MPAENEPAPRNCHWNSAIVPSTANEFSTVHRGLVKPFDKTPYRPNIAPTSVRATAIGTFWKPHFCDRAVKLLENRGSQPFGS
ncbi:MAG: hypothetical protein K6B54_03580 [Clostridia bacterium]|nr:hypothetical protein [Clostridia bacterium]